MPPSRGDGLAVSPRRMRQSTKKLAPSSSLHTPAGFQSPASARVKFAESATTPSQSITLIPHLPSQALTGLSRRDHKLLLKKRDFLRKYSTTIPKDFQRHAASTVHATLVFAQEEAGTAVCVAPEGLLLTCAHCVAETEEELDYAKTHWLLFADGTTVGAQCVAWDARRDLALLRIVAAQERDSQLESETLASESTSTSATLRQCVRRFTFPHVQLAVTPPAVGGRLVCIGHPGSEDLEAAQAGVKTGYDVLHLSTGAFRGLAPNQDPHDNSEIGALMHDCWTYWGHSGAPVFERRGGGLVGLHSSWDNETGMRRGVPLEALSAFLADRLGRVTRP